MLKISSVAHYIIILSVVFAGLLSTHICLDGDVDTNSSISLVVDGSDSEASTASIGCDHASCCQHCSHLFDVRNNLVSNFSTIDVKTIGNMNTGPLLSQYPNPPSRPPRA